MTPNPLIETYVGQVAARLPRAQRQDVAAELRLLLAEEQQARADTAGRPADEALTLAMLQAFGRPAEVAARYRAPISIIDPADSSSFLRAAWIGTLLIWVLSLAARLQQPIADGGQLLGVIAQWWTGTVIASLWWPGLLVVGFGLAAWSRRRWPERAAWQPPSTPHPQIVRAGHVLGLVGMVCGLLVLADPRSAMALAFGGPLPAGLSDAFTYAEPFRQRQGWTLLVLLLLQIPLQLITIAHGRRQGLWRRLHIGLSVLTCLAMAWALLDGPIVLGTVSDGFIRLAFAIVIGATVLDLGRQAWRVWQARRRPAMGGPGWNGL